MPKIDLDDLDICRHCAGSGISAYGPVENSCPYCKGRGVEWPKEEEYEREYDPVEEWERRRRRDESYSG